MERDSFGIKRPSFGIDDLDFGLERDIGADSFLSGFGDRGKPDFDFKSSGADALGLNSKSDKSSYDDLHDPHASFDDWDSKDEEEIPAKEYGGWGQ